MRVSTDRTAGAGRRTTGPGNRGSNGRCPATVRCSRRSAGSGDGPGPGCRQAPRGGALRVVPRVQRLLLGPSVGAPLSFPPRPDHPHPVPHPARRSADRWCRRAVGAGGPRRNGGAPPHARAVREGGMCTL